MSKTRHMVAALAGTYPVVGAKMAEIINGNVEGVTATTVAGGTEANFALMAQGEVEIVLTYGFVAQIG